MIPHNVKLVEERCAIAFLRGEPYLVETYPDFYLVNDKETENTLKATQETLVIALPWHGNHRQRFGIVVVSFCVSRYHSIPWFHRQGYNVGGGGGIMV